MTSIYIIPIGIWIDNSYSTIRSQGWIEIITEKEVYIVPENQVIERRTIDD